MSGLFTPLSRIRRLFDSKAACLMAAMFVTFGALSLPQHAAAQAPQSEVVKPLVMAVPNNVFAGLKHGKLRGIIAEATDTVLKSMGHEVTYISMPGREVSRSVQDGSVDVGTSLLKLGNSQRNALYTNPILLEYNVILVRRGEAFPLERISDLYGRQIGARIGFKYPLIENDPQVTLIRAESDGANVRRLMLGKLDAIIVGGASDLYDLRAEGVMSELETMEKAVGYVQLGAALADERFTLEDLVKFNAELAKLRSSSRWEDILSRNGFLDLVHEWPLITE